MPGRFNKNILRQSIFKVLGIELDVNSFEDTKSFIDIGTERLLMILAHIKTFQSKDTEICGICCCEELGDFPTVVIRGNENIGILRSVTSNTESISLYTRKIATENYSLLHNFLPEHISRFKIACNCSDLNRSLIIIRL